MCNTNNCCNERRDKQPRQSGSSYEREGNYFRNIHTGKLHTEQGMKEEAAIDRYERIFS